MKTSVKDVHTSLSNLYAILHAGKIILRHPGYQVQCRCGMEPLTRVPDGQQFQVPEGTIVH